VITSENKISIVKHYGLLIKGIYVKSDNCMIALYRDKTTTQIIMGIVDTLKSKLYLK
jgi:hypothetical protein